MVKHPYAHQNHIIWLILAAMSVVCLPAAALDNAGDVVYDTSAGTNIIVADGYTNSGTVTALGNVLGRGAVTVSSGGFTNNGTVNANGNAQVSYGIFVGSGGFTNSGTVYANGNGSSSKGIEVSDGFTNSGTVYANGNGNSGYGIDVFGGFTNSGTVYANANVSDSLGINVFDGFINSGKVYATSVGGEGIWVNSGGFTNTGMVNAVGEGGGNTGLAASSGGLTNAGVLSLGGSARSVGLGSGVHFLPGSVLALGGGYVHVNSNEFLVQPGTQMVATLTADGSGGMVSHRVFQTLTSLNQTAPTTDALATAFGVGHGPVLEFDFTDAGSNNYNVEVTRVNLASNLVRNGNAGQFTSQLETALHGQDVTGDSPFYSYALARSIIDSQSTLGRVKQTAARVAKERTPQATTTALPLLTDAARMAPDLLGSRMLGAFTAMRDGETAARQTIASASGTAYANLSPVHDRSLLVWSSPFYHYGKFDPASNSGYSEMKEHIGGLSFGIAAGRGEWVWAAAAHYLYADLDGESDYDATAHGYGATLGAGRALHLGNFSPWLQLTTGYTHFELEQTRRESLLYAAATKSKPGLDIVTAALDISNPFDCRVFVLTPKLGVDYAHTRMQSYSETGTVLASPMHVSRNRTNSLRGIAGLSAVWQLPHCVSLEARTVYRHEFLDTRSDLAWRDAAGLPFGFTTKGRDAGRSSGTLGTGIQWRPTDRTIASIDYDFHLAKRYTAHRATLRIGVSF